MRTGYCILLGEYIEAPWIEYRDCEALQIVCPSCYEPVFKVVANRDAEEKHYLSHYRKDAAFDAECELRVKSVSIPEQQRHNSDSREQRLLYFLRVFLSALQRDPFISYRHDIQRTHSEITRSRSYREFRAVHFEQMRAGMQESPDAFRDFAADYWNDIGQWPSGIPKTVFATEVQTRIAFDMLKCLVTEPGRSNYCALFNHSALYLAGRVQSKAEGSNDSSGETTVCLTLSHFLEGLLSGVEDRVRAALFEMRNTPINPPWVAEPSSYLLKVSSEISHEMVGSLLRLPYFELLRDYVAKRVDSTAQSAT